MKIIEVRDGFIVIEADEGVYLSSFIKVTGMGKDYIAQINRIQTFKTVTIATAKILFVMRDEELFNYDKTLPSKDSEIFPYTLDILSNSINAEKPVIVGKTFDNSGNIVIDASAFNKKMLISVDNTKLNHILLSNFEKQFKNIGIKTVVIDTNNSVKTEKVYAGKSFKLPLNKLTMQYLFNACLNDATPDSKSLISDVFKDLLEYAESVSFVPFGAFKSIVDEMVDKQHVFKLFVLKNKLSFLQKTGYFADKISDVESVKEILNSDNPVIDISLPDKNLQNCYLEYIYSLINPKDTQVLLEASNAISKKNLKTIIKESDVSTAFVVNSRYTYLNDIKVLFDNFIIEPSRTNNTVFKVYSSFLSSMNEGTYLIAGEGINYIPMISKAQVIDELVEYSKDEAHYEPEDIYKNEEDVSEIDTEEKTSDEMELVEQTVSESTEEMEEEDLAVLENSAQEQETEAEEEIDFKQEEIEPEKETEPVKPTKEEIIADIDKKSEDAINAISKNLENVENIDLFNDLERQEEETSVVNEVIEEASLEEESTKEELLIEPEYTELKENEASIEEDTLDIEPAEGLEFKSEDEIVNLDNIEEEPLKEDSAEYSLSDEEYNIEETFDEIPDIVEQNDETPVELQDVSGFDNSEVLDESGDVLSDNPSEEFSDTDIQELELGTYGEITETDDGEEFSSEDAGQAILYNDNINLDELASSDDGTDNNLSHEDIIELDPDESDENDIIIDISDEEENINIDEELDRQIVDDVDKVYTTMKEPEEIEEISDSDLDFIDELNSDNDEDLIEEYNGNLDEGMLEPPTESVIPEKKSQEEVKSEILEKRDSNTPIVPVYDADIPQEDMVVSDPIQQGDSVVHAKYGNGIVEKMIKYGTKTLFSINFENIGRRLLDPTLTEIKKL